LLYAGGGWTGLRVSRNPLAVMPGSFASFVLCDGEKCNVQRRAPRMAPFFIQENLFDIDLVFYLLQDLVADSIDVLQVVD